jgi:flagellar hook-associated protein 2
MATTSTTSTTTSSATSSLVTALGGGSGIDMTALATNLAVAQFAGRVDQLSAKSDTLDKQISAASNIKSMLSGLSTSLGDRVRTGDLSPKPLVANTAIASGTLSGTARPVGTYSLEVTQLASSQTLTSGAFTASTTPVGSGTLTLRFGTVSGTGFIEDATHAAVPITIPSGATLADTAAAINAAGAGVTAYVASTSEGAKLVLKGQEGVTNGFVLDATETPGEPGLAALAWQPSTGAAARMTSTAGDAAFKIDGLAMTSKSNAVTDAVPGLNLSLTGTNAGVPTKVTFADTSSAITTAMADLVGALNEIASQVATATDPQTGDLARDSGAQALKRNLASLTTTVIMPNAAQGVPQSLSDLGVSIQRDGTFSFDAARLTQSMTANPDAVSAMFTNGLYGVYSTIDSVTRQATSASDPGSIGGSIARYTTQKTTVTADQAKLAEQQEDLRVRMVARFAATDTQIGVSKSTLSFLQNQIAAWNKSS